jgi:hypothetical protein
MHEGLMTTFSGVMKKVDSLKRWLTTLEDGLRGKHHVLGAGEGDYFQKYVKTIGLELLTITAAHKRGLELRKGAKPICSRYYPRPISSYHHLYLLEQFKRIQKKASSPTEKPEEEKPEN